MTLRILAAKEAANPCHHHAIGAGDYHYVRKTPFVSITAFFDIDSVLAELIAHTVERIQGIAIKPV